MKKKTKIISIVTTIVVLGIVAILLTTGGLIVVAGPDYSYDYGYGSKESGSGFIPRHFHLEWDPTPIPLFPVVLHVWKLSVPRDLIINRSDPTYLESHSGFEAFRVDSLTITYDSGRVVQLISPEVELSDRTFTVTREWDKRIIIEGAIDEKSGFIYRIEGESIRNDGVAFPFTYEVRHDYRWVVEWGTRFEYWASV